MSERTSSFSSSASCPSMTGPSPSDATLSPSVRSLSPISPLPNVPTFCLTPYPEQTAFPEPINNSPISSPRDQDEHNQPSRKSLPHEVYNQDRLYAESDSCTQLEGTGGKGNQSPQTSIPIKATKPPPPPRRRQTSPSFLIPPSLKMSSLTSTIPSPTNPPPLSPGGRSKVPHAVGRPRIGRSATISSNTLGTSSKSNIRDNAELNTQKVEIDIGRIIKRIPHMGERRLSNDAEEGIKRKPRPLILNRAQSASQIPSNPSNPAKAGKIPETTSLRGLERPQTPVPPLPVANSIINPDEDPNCATQVQNQNHPIPSTSGKSTAKPLTSRRVGSTDEPLNHDRWSTEQQLQLQREREMADPEPTLNQVISPGWGQFNLT
ncbi:uncharacterized protein I303_103357 [Kwoniella dejecticola CBS 10117]|uniref:Uncharacterized protein n=1 Tax=Kwoniella dejecticola CBS 10117 TaxID=1296121 RepID=A0A1A6A6I8_9TREE|nr:uncharacterized protein I303_03380 [Kwoniella dejecticola CBS 10117]OBR85669.1 hypothetical protein I303_03380 [Kwoniella dejecticola CBS 10117]